jgi:prepilin-type N-terminal cleavage/methylation domain-containing protein
MKAEGRDQRSEVRGRRAFGFTLLELMAVMSIILILAGLVIGTTRYVSYKNRVSRAQAEIKTMELVLQEYKQDVGRFPACSSSNMNLTAALANSKELFKALSGNTNGDSLLPSAGKQAYFKAFREGKQGNVAKDTSDNKYYIVDPWGNPYQYINSGLTNRVTFDLGSAGPDGAFNSADDVFNWKF